MNIPQNIRVINDPVSPEMPAKQLDALAEFFKDVLTAGSSNQFPAAAAKG